MVGTRTPRHVNNKIANQRNGHKTSALANMNQSSYILQIVDNKPAKTEDDPKS